MSYDAVDWAFSVKVGSLADKAVLLALCHAHNPEKGCFPSVETIMDLTEIGSKRTVQKSLNALEAAGFIARSRKPTKKGFVNLYTLNLGKSKSEPRIKSEPTCKSEPRIKNEPRSTFTEVGAEVSLRGRCKSEPLTSNREQVKGTSNVFTRDASHRTEQNASIPDDVPAWVIDQQSSDSYSEVASTSGGASVSDCGSAVSSREDTLSLTPNEPPAPKKGAKRSNLAARPDDVSEEVWKDYQTLRKAKRAPVTDTVINGLRREAGAAGITLEQAMTFCIERGYQGFKADWYKNAANVGGRPQRDTTRFAHEWRQEDRVYVTDEKMEEMRKTLAMFKEKKSA